MEMNYKFVSSKMDDVNPMARKITLINESGLYNAIIGSKKPEAKAFKKWITSEVLPSIRKHGGYIKDQEKMSPELLIANALKMADSIIKEQKQKIEQARRQLEENLTVDAYRSFHKREYWTHSLKVRLGQLASTLCRSEGAEVGVQERVIQTPFGEKVSKVHMYPKRILDKAFSMLGGE